MGHTIGKDIYRQLGKKIDGLQVRTPWNNTFYEILKELYTPEEAEILVSMPVGLASFREVAKTTGCEEKKLQSILESLCEKGLVFDLWLNEKYYYMPSPLAVGIFEMTMMRTGPGLNYKKWAALFHEYMHGDGSFYRANFGDGQRVSIARTLPHVEAVTQSDHVEVLDYEKANTIVENSERIAVGLCSCRHEAFHLGEKSCDIPLEKCTSFGTAAEYLIRHHMAREATKEEALEIIARSKEEKLVLTADNVKAKPSFICHCCKCCCNILRGISQHGYPNAIVTSTFISRVEESKCTGCEKCVKECPINAIEMVTNGNGGAGKVKTAKVDTSICIGCGVCALSCRKDAVRLVKRKQKVLHPETTFERVILQSLERGTLENQIFKNPKKITQKVARGVVGGFLRLSPVKKALMSDKLRSSFLETMTKGTRTQGKDWLIDM